MVNTVPQDGQRCFQRCEVSLTVSVWLADTNGCEETVNYAFLAQPRMAFVDELSVQGLRFVSPVAFPLLCVVGVRLRLGAHTFPLEGIVRRREVQWVSGKRCYECGVQFVRTPSTPEAVLCIAKYLMSERSALSSAALPDKSASPYPPPSMPALTPKSAPWEL